MFKPEFFINNRAKLAKELPDSLMLVAANSLLQRSADTTFNFRQDSSFWYLTGLDEPDLLLMIENGQSTLVLPKREPHRDLWEGKIDVDQLKKSSGIRKVISSGGFAKHISQAKANKKVIGRLKPMPGFIDALGMSTNPARLRLEKQLKGCKKQDIRLELARLRQIKQPAELKAIQKAIDITVESFKTVKKQLAKLRNERTVANLLTAEFALRGADDHAYAPIVASGKNACTLHYVKNDAPITKNQLLLIDAGAEYYHYAADITRTREIGRANSAMKLALAIVKKTQKYAFGQLKPGILLKDYEAKVHDFLAQELVKSKLAANLDAAKKACPHAISHFLGLDVHDAADYQLPLAENMVLTVEPGVYLPNLGVGVRIEDDVLITKNGCRNLSAGLPQ